MSTNGSDGDSGAASAPWRTIKHAVAAVMPGQTLWVRGGTYVENVTGVSIHPATAASPIVVRAYPSERPVIEGLLWLSSPSYWTLDGINVTWNSSNNASQHMVKITNGVGWSYLNGEIWGARSYAGLLVASTKAGQPADWTVARNCIHDTYESNSTNQDHLIYVNSGLSGTGGTIERNVMFNAVNGEGVKLGGPDSSEGSAGVTVRYNTVYNTGQNVLVAWQSHDNQIYRNLFDKVNLSLSAAYGNVRGYQLTGANNVARNNFGYEAKSLLFNDTGYEGVGDGGGNVFPRDPNFDHTSCSGFHPQDSVATSYGAYA